MCNVISDNPFRSLSLFLAFAPCLSLSLSLSHILTRRAHSLLLMRPWVHKHVRMRVYAFKKFQSYTTFSLLIFFFRWHLHSFRILHIYYRSKIWNHTSIQFYSRFHSILDRFVKKKIFYFSNTWILFNLSTDFWQKNIFFFSFLIFGVYKLVISNF